MRGARALAPGLLLLAACGAPGAPRLVPPRELPDAGPRGAVCQVTELSGWTRDPSTGNAVASEGRRCFFDLDGQPLLAVEARAGLTRTIPTEEWCPGERSEQRGIERDGRGRIVRTSTTLAGGRPRELEDRHITELVYDGDRLVTKRVAFHRTTSMYGPPVASVDVRRYTYEGRCEAAAERYVAR